MSNTPAVYETVHRVRFSDLDPYQHMRTAVYSAYYMDHRMEGLRENVGWDLKTLATLPFMLWTTKLEIDFLRSVVGDQEMVIRSFVREFRGPDAHIECSMIDEKGRPLSQCRMIVACIDRNTNRSMDWPAETMALFYERETA